MSTKIFILPDGNRWIATGMNITHAADVIPETIDLVGLSEKDVEEVKENIHNDKLINKKLSNLQDSISIKTVDK